MLLNERLKEVSETSEVSKGLSKAETGIVLGIDTKEAYRPAIDLISRLGFERQELTLVNAVNTTCPIPFANAHTQADYLKVLENIGISALDQAARKAKDHGIKVTTRLAFGRAADSLMNEANQRGSEIISLFATKHGKWSNGYLGSAACALALNADQTLLIVKKPLQKNADLRAVFAVDHSSKTEANIQRFLDLMPKGIGEILLLSAYEINDETANSLRKNLSMFAGDIDRMMQDDFEEKNLRIVDRLRDRGYKVKSKVIAEEPNKAIHESMIDFQADLLVLGSTGASGAANAKIGSIALHQASSENYSILMLR